ncbi:hypothetical protein Tco_0332675 [Tanacetum coccineum]
MDGGDDGDARRCHHEGTKRMMLGHRGDYEEEEVHLAPAESGLWLYQISIPTPVPTPLWSDAEVAILLAISTPPSSPLSPWSSPLPQIPSPSLPLSPPSPVLSPAPPPSPIRSLGYRAAMIQMRAEAASTSHSLPLSPPFILSPTRLDAPLLGIPPLLPISVPTSSPPLLLPSSSRREDRPEVTLPPRKRLGITLGPRYEVGESSSAAAARPARGGAPVSTDTESGSTYDNIWRLGLGCIWMWLIEMETEARLSREAWRRSMDASDLARGEVMSLRTTVLAQMSEIRELHDADRRRQAVTSEMLKADHRRGDSTTGTGDHLAGAGDSLTGIGGAYKDKVTGIYRIGYRTTGTAGTRWRSCTARAARGGW